MSKATEPDEEKEIATVTSADGTEIVYERSGSGPPSVFVHGSTVDRVVWELGDVRSRFAEHTTVHAMDRRYHGDSGSPDEYSGKPDPQFDDVVAVVESIDDPVTLIGHSYGALVALGAAPRIDNLRSLILYEPPIVSKEGFARLEGTVEEMITLIEAGENEQAYTLFLGDIAKFAPDELDAIRSAPVWDRYTDRFPQTLLPELEAGAESGGRDLTPFENLTTPTLLPVGTESGWLKESAEKVHDTLPNSRLVTFDGHGHALYFVAPERFTDEVLSFISDVD
ncbi:alpha/beta hydrolase fold protein [Natronococcus amylolyticus DSM 10524]|uniref:Alpha/beta hydrolase fold protein n=1 Tax=Natronococcus amylolyticus DSM 10524 TaxID=1227497 RepID=L9X3Q9_9EURY|nr:alpha/beta hydrolase [Natronococcus amylolyticus]ELY56252.1 alpha/beta hydrolase fold protein [Natronococcus amylolyticus DSM 10524]